MQIAELSEQVIRITELKNKEKDAIVHEFINEKIIATHQTNYTYDQLNRIKSQATARISAASRGLGNYGVIM